jgi:hypothetical protein
MSCYGKQLAGSMLMARLNPYGRAYNIAVASGATDAAEELDGLWLETYSLILSLAASPCYLYT